MYNAEKCCEKNSLPLISLFCEKRCKTLYTYNHVHCIVKSNTVIIQINKKKVLYQSDFFYAENLYLKKYLFKKNKKVRTIIYLQQMIYFLKKGIKTV